MTQVIDKKVKCKLVGVDGNAYSLMDHFSHCAKKEGWTQDEIKKVMDEAMKGDYDHLLRTLGAHCKKGGF